MLIQELSSQASLDVLARTRLGRLACTQGGQPYIVPVYLAYADHALYGVATVGKKIEWMRVNPLVCIEMDEVVSPQRWTSVLVFGRYEELPDVFRDKKVLGLSNMWWEPAYVKTILGGVPRPLVPVFYRIHIVQATGHQATPDPAPPPAACRSTVASDEAGWLEKLLRLLRGKRRQ